jgi:hypothetical protein
VQQLGLQRGVQLADLVQEDRAAVGQLEPSGLALVRAGEGAALVAEELGLQQFARHRRAVHLDEGGAAPRGVSVDRVSDDLLAHAGLAADEDGDVGPRGLLDDGLDLAHRRTHQEGQLGLQAVVAGLERRRRALGTWATGGRADRRLQIAGGVGAAHDVVGAGLDRLHDLPAVAAVGDHDHRAAFGELGRPPDEVDARHSGQGDGDQRERKARRPERVERFLAARHGVRRVAPVRELRDRAPALIGIAFHHERVPRRGARRQRRRGGGFQAGDLHRVSSVRTSHASASGVPNAFVVP